MLTRWNPFEEMQRIQDQFFGSRESTALRPAVDIHESEDAIRVMAELPGIKPDDVHVEIEDNVLTLRGERKLEHEEDQEGYHRIERSYGSFSRSFVLPRTVDANAIEASMDNGTLTVQIPKRKETQPRKIDVKPSKGGDEVQVNA